MARRGYPPEFRRRVVDLVEGGRKVSEVAAEFEVSEHTGDYGSQWEAICSIAEKKGPAGVPYSSPGEEGPCARPRTAKAPVTALPSCRVSSWSLPSCRVSSWSLPSYGLP
jgi:hypothetical protein